MKWLLFGDFHKVTGEKAVHVYVDRHATVDDALEALLAERPEIETLISGGRDILARDDVYLLHNHRSVIDEAGLGTELEVGDELGLFSEVGDG